MVSVQSPPATYTAYRVICVRNTKKMFPALMNADAYKSWCRIYSKSSKYVVISTQIQCLFTLRPGLACLYAPWGRQECCYPAQILVRTKTGDYRKTLVANRKCHNLEVRQKSPQQRTYRVLTSSVSFVMTLVTSGLYT